jgi:hypothetical protein
VPLGDFFKGRKADDRRAPERIILEERLAGAAVTLADNHFEFLADVSDRLKEHFS